MSDQRLRSLERAAASGDLGAQARQLAERLRIAESCAACDGKGSGPPTSGPKAGRKDYRATCEACAGFRSAARARVALAAVCGHLPAYEAIEPFTHRGHWDQPLAEWLPILGRWSAQPFRAKTRAHMAAHLLVCEATRAASRFPEDQEEGCRWTDVESFHCDDYDITDAVEKFGEKRVRAAIQQALVSWALGPP
jgi:hypothetical protein